MGKILNLMAVLAMIFSITGCSTTTVEEIKGNEGEEATSTVTVTAKAPVFSTRSDTHADVQGGTRAQTGYQLRYKAFLFKEETNEDTEEKYVGDYVSAQEALDDNGATFIFNVDEERDYVILFVADYIKLSNNNKIRKSIYIDKSEDIEGYDDESSCYKIQFSWSIRGALTMKTDAGEKFAPYNNDNYEVFTGKVSFTKGHTKDTLKPIMLNRPVCKITVAEAEESIDNYKIDITKFNMGTTYDIYNEKVSAPEEIDPDDEDYTILSKNINIANSEKRELFYFYAFANPGDDGMNISEDGMTFVAKNGANSLNCTIAKDKFVCQPNYKYTLKGTFLNPNKGEVKITVNTNGWGNNGTTTIHDL